MKFLHQRNNVVLKDGSKSVTAKYLIWDIKFLNKPKITFSALRSKKLSVKTKTLKFLRTEHALSKLKWLKIIICFYIMPDYPLVLEVRDGSLMNIYFSCLVFKGGYYFADKRHDKVSILHTIDQIYIRGVNPFWMPSHFRSSKIAKSLFGCSFSSKK